MCRSSGSIVLPPVGAREPLQRSRKRYRNRTKRDSENPGNLAVAQALGPEGEAAPVDSGKGFDDRHQPALPLRRREMLFGAGRGVGVPACNILAGLRPVPCLPVLSALLQGEVMRHPKDPSAKVAPRAVKLQMAEEAEEDLLHDLFAVVHRNADGHAVAKHRRAEALKQLHDFALDLSARARRAGIQLKTEFGD